MSGFATAIVGLYDKLSTATFSGVPFHVADTSTVPGRRVQQWFFPGVGDAIYQDLGKGARGIELRGVLVGDDYLAQAAALTAALEEAGPYTLVHPWLGTLQVIYLQPPRISFSERELRFARFEGTFFLWPSTGTAPTLLDTLSQLAVSIDEVTASAETFIASAIAPLVGILGAFSYAQSWVTSIAGIFAGVIPASASAGEIGPAAAPALAALASPTVAPTAGWATTTAAAVLAVPAAIAASATPLVPSAVAPGGSVTATAAATPLVPSGVAAGGSTAAVTATAAAASPADAVSTLLAAIPAIAAGASAASPGPALAASLQAATVAYAVQAASSIAYASQQDAQAQEAILMTAIDAAAAAAASAVSSSPTLAATLWRSLADLKASLAADMNSVIGRLPAVVTINTRWTVPAWILAQYVSGDDPGDVVATYTDLVARNTIRHPALVPPGAIEVLDQ
jgi:prophage DNA circulation protein